MTTSPRALPLARNVVQRLDRRQTTSLCTVPVLDAAGELLHAWCATAADHGTDMAGDYPGDAWAQRLGSVALEMAARAVREPRPVSPQKADTLLDAVAARLAERGISTSRSERYVPVPRTDSTPAWGTSGMCSLAITIDIGWALVLDQPHGSPVVEIVGRCDEVGIDAMLDLAMIVNDGAFGNVFLQP